VASGWKIADGKLTLTAEVPANTTATVRLPQAKLEQVSEGGKPVAGRAEFSKGRQERDAVVLFVGSGSYSFESSYVAPEVSKPKKAESPIF
jgi:alpha-L-rhamnosidase